MDSSPAAEAEVDRAAAEVSRELKADMGGESVATIGGAPSNDCSQARRVAATDGLTAIDPGYEGAVVGGETDRDRREVHNRRVSAGACFRSS